MTFTEEFERLEWLFWAELAEKLILIQKVSQRVRSILDDYLGNESFAFMLMRQTWRLPPEDRENQLNVVISILVAKTVEEIISLFDWHNVEWTDDNRTFILWKLWIQHA